MSVETRLLQDAEQLDRQVAGTDHEVLYGRIVAAMMDEHTDDAETDDRDASAVHREPICTQVSERPMPPLAEVRHHLGHALHNAGCARRTAELFELLGYDDAAATCWYFAAGAGDRDAQDYVAEFYAAPADLSVNDSRQRFVELAESYA
jgi:hypothetical protein